MRGGKRGSGGRRGRSVSSTRPLKSSEVNPTLSVHRSAAKLQWAKALPVDEQPVLGVVAGQDSKIEVDSESGGASRLTAFTHCTNATFDRVHRTWRSGSGLQTEVVAVLAAITELIQGAGGEESEAEYFAALLTALEGTPPGSRAAATAYLLSLVIGKLQPGVLQARYSAASKTLATALGGLGTSEKEENLPRYMLSAFFGLLKAQPAAIWTDPHNLRILESLLSFATSPHPRVRKTVRSGASFLIEAGSDAGTAPPHPLGRIVAEMTVRALENYDLASGKGCEEAERLLELAALVMHRMCAESLRKVAETILRLLSAEPRSTRVLETAMRALITCFVHCPSKASLPAALNAQILNALYDLKPSSSSVGLVSLWLGLLTEAHVSLVRKDPGLFAANAQRLPDFYSEVLGLIEKGVVDEKSGVRLAVRLSGQCWPDLDLSIPSVKAALDRSLDVFKRPLDSLASIDLWPPAMKMAACVMSHVESGLASSPSFVALVQRLSELRSGSESEEPRLRSLVEGVVSAAVRFVGLGAVLSAVPLDIDPGALSPALEFPRSWLLPLIRKAAANVQLQFYLDHFLPLAMNLGNAVRHWQSQGKASTAHMYAVVETQIWDLLPVFCQEATDVATHLTELAKVMGMLLVKRPLLRLQILKALRALIQRHEGESERAAVAKYAKNFIPILLNLYTSKEETKPSGYDVCGTEAAVLSTLRLYLGIAPTALLDTYLETALGRLSEIRNEASSPSSRGRKPESKVLDVIAALIPQLSAAQLERVLKRVWPWLSPGRDRAARTDGLEKKAYRILEEAAAAGTEASAALLSAQLPELLSLLDWTDGVAAAARPARLRLLRHVLAHASEVALARETHFAAGLKEHLHFLANATSNKLRKVAAQGFGKIAGLWMKSSAEDGATVLTRVAELIGKESAKYPVAVVMAHRILLHQFGTEFNSQLLNDLVRSLRANLGTEQIKVVENSLLLMKKLLNTLPGVSLRLYGDLLLTAFFGQDECVRKSLRRINDWLLRSMILKLGLGQVEKAAPSQWQGQLRNVRKRLSRKSRKEAAAHGHTRSRGDSASSGDGDASMATSYGGLSTFSRRADTIADLLEDSDSGAEGPAKSVAGTRFSRKAPVWLEEGDEEEIVDLLGKKLAQQMVAVDPVLKKEKEKKRLEESNRGFSIAPDGRLILAAKDEDTQKDAEYDMEDEESELPVLGKRKRRLGEDVAPKRVRFGEDVDDDDDDEDDAKSGYKPGGQGIHRDVSGKGKKRDPMKGDAKKKGQKLDPYSYIPLEFSSLNKRKRAKVAGKFKSLVKGARKGAAKSVRRK